MNDFQVAKILSYLQGKTYGILWLTEKKFDEQPLYFTALDYVLDGLLIKNLQHQQEEDQAKDQNLNLFVSPYFNHMIYLAHLHLNQQSKDKTYLSKQISSVLELIKEKYPLQENDVDPEIGEILILTDQDSSFYESFLPAIEKKFRNFHFKIIESM